MSHAKAFRRDLVRAFGIERRVIKKSRRNGRELTLVRWQPEHEFTARERELFAETDHTLPVDFHSWRRAFSQALADADVNVQQATALAGHSSLEAHARYLANSGKMRRLPSAAFPRIRIGDRTHAVSERPTTESQTSKFSSGRDRA